MAGKDVEFEVSRKNFKTAFGNTKNHADLEVNKSKFNLI